MRNEIHTCNNGETCAKCHTEGVHATCYGKACEYQAVASPAHTCSICFSTYEGHGNNALPVNDGRCCSECNAMIVVPARIRREASIARRVVLAQNDLSGVKA